MASPLVIDCDPGVDDAVAILLALASPEVELLALTTVAGNLPLETTTRNALRVLALAGRDDIPVAAGAERPLVVPRWRDSSVVHGSDGLGGAPAPEPQVPVVPMHAVDLLVEVLERSEEPVLLSPVGPLTNIALLAAADRIANPAGYDPTWLGAGSLFSAMLIAYAIAALWRLRPVAAT